MYATPLFSNERIQMEPVRLSFNQIVDKAFWVLLSVIAVWAGAQIKELTTSVQSLNSTMVGLSYKVEAAQGELVKASIINEKQDDRLRNIELELIKLRLKK